MKKPINIIGKNKFSIEPSEGLGQVHIGQWRIFEGSVISEKSSGITVPVDFSDISAEYLPSPPVSGYPEGEGKGGFGFDAPPKFALLEEKKSFVIQLLKDAKPETLEKFFTLAVQEAGTLPPGLVAPSSSPAPSPADAPPLWAERTTGRKVSPVDWIRRHYGNKDPDNWDPMGLTRARLGQIDKKLYEAYARQISRSPESGIPELPSEPRQKRIDPEEALERVKAQTRASVARHRKAM